MTDPADPWRLTNFVGDRKNIVGDGAITIIMEITQRETE